MKTIDKEILEKTKTYIDGNCRDLVKEQFVHFFERENTQGVITALSAFQNPDGGFGHGLERDFILPASSSIATAGSG